jgi:cell division protein FtsI (penicillin-binding protein 3)
MLESVVAAGGTGTRAQVRGYRIAGKTGTVRKSGIGGYVDDKYVAVFAGLAPVSQPQLVCVVMINEPGGDEYYGGQVAGPVFANVMAGALRLLNIAPDALPQNARFAQAGTADSSPAETGGRL